jgi:hypothetical protein
MAVAIDTAWAARATSHAKQFPAVVLGHSQSPGKCFVTKHAAGCAAVVAMQAQLGLTFGDHFRFQGGK